MHTGGFYLLPFALGARARGRGQPARRRARLLSAIVFVAASAIVFADAAAGGAPPPPPAAPIRTVRPHWSAAGDGARADRQRRGRRLREDDGGEVWTARSYDEDEVIDAGEQVEVVEIRGATALVMHRAAERCDRGKRKDTAMVALIVVAVVVCSSLFVAARAIRVIPQARAGVVERLGRYSRTLEPGLTIVTPFIDRVRPLVDLREQVVNFSPQSVITEDNVVVAIETVLYFTITDPRSATYEIANPLQAIEQLTVTTLRNVIGGLTLEETLTAARTSTPSCARCSTRRPASGGSGSTGWRSSRSTRRRTSGRRWRSRCAPSATGALRS